MTLNLFNPPQTLHSTSSRITTVRNPCEDSVFPIKVWSPQTCLRIRAKYTDVCRYLCYCIHISKNIKQRKPGRLIRQIYIDRFVFITLRLSTTFWKSAASFAGADFPPCPQDSRLLTSGLWTHRFRSCFRLLLMAQGDDLEPESDQAGVLITSTLQELSPRQPNRAGGNNSGSVYLLITLTA